MRGQVEHILTMANLKLKPSLFTPRPNVECMNVTCSINNCTAYVLLRVNCDKINILTCQMHKPAQTRRVSAFDKHQN